MTVIAAVKLDNHVAACITPCQPDGTHGRLGSGTDESDLFKGGDRIADQLGKFHLKGTGSTKACSPGCGFADSLITSGWACPSIMGPQDPTKSINSLPSTSVIMHPSALATNSGSQPTDLQARTGELTPPGMTCRAWSNKTAERSVFIVHLVTVQGSGFMLLETFDYSTCLFLLSKAKKMASPSAALAG